jgi:hypothetical protein
MGSVDVQLVVFDTQNCLRKPVRLFPRLSVTLVPGFSCPKQRAFFPWQG